MTSPQESGEKNVVCVALGKNLKAIRIAASKSQETLAFEADIDRTYISAIERGLANPSVLTLASLCCALEISLAELFAAVTIKIAVPHGVRKRATSTPKSRLR